MSAPHEKVAAGTLLDEKYRVVRLLGKGAMGAVYEVENIKVRRSAALKLLPSTASADIVGRFEAEAQAAGRAGSKRIVDVLDLGRTASGQPYMVMELLEGETLRDELKRARRMTPKRATTLLVDVLLGLEAAHAAGIVHRDLKPENIWVLAEPPEPRPLTGETGIVKILDFGVSRFSSGGDEDAPRRPRTAEGTMIGTCWYMSPEQIRDARNADARADLYAIGVMLCELVSGNVPFPGGTIPELLYKILEEPAEDPRRQMPSFPETLAQIALRALEKLPDARFTSAAEMREHLVAYLEERPPLHIDLGSLDVPEPRRKQAAVAALPSTLDIALDAPERPARPSTLETWRATLDSPGSQRSLSTPVRESERVQVVASRPATPPSIPSIGETIPFPLSVSAAPPSSGSRSAPVSTPIPSSPRVSAPPELAIPVPRSGPVSEAFDPASVSLAFVPQRVDVRATAPWPRGAVILGAVSLAVIVLSSVVGLLLRADALGL